MFKPKRIQEFPRSDRFLFLRLMRSIQEVGLERDDTKLESAASECLARLAKGDLGCPLGRIFLDDYVNTELPTALAFLRSADVDHDDATLAGGLLESLLVRVKSQAEACGDSQYLESVLACQSFINNGDRACPFYWVKNAVADSGPVVTETPKHNACEV